MRTWTNMIAAAVALCATSLSFGIRVDAADNPNVIFILADDMGYGDVGALNPESKIKTPNLDANSPSAKIGPRRHGLYRCTLQFIGVYSDTLRCSDGTLQLAD